MKNILFKCALGIFSCLMFFIISCKDEPKQKTQEFDRKSMLENIGSNVIIPTYDTLKQTTELLNIAIKSFKDSPSSASLIKAQNAWKAAAYRWAMAEMVKFGPAENIFLEENINYWPISSAAIESEISGKTEFSSDYITTIGVTKKGFSALEYLLFSKQGNEVVLKQYIDNNARKNYLMALSENVSGLASKTYQAWLPTGSNYVGSFISASGTDVNSSTGFMINSMIMKLEDLINKKIGRPAGLSVASIVDPSKVEASYSDYSNALMLANIKSLTSIFTGTNGSSNGVGFDDYFNFIKADYNGTPLASTVTYRMKSFEKAIMAIPNPYASSLGTSTQPAKDAWTAGKSLLVLMKVDVPSQLGVTITFTDNDGD